MFRKIVIDICHTRWKILASCSEISREEIPVFSIPESLRSTCYVQGDVIGAGKATGNMILPHFSSGSHSVWEAKHKDRESKMPTQANPTQPNKRQHRLNKSKANGWHHQYRTVRRIPVLERHGITWWGQAFCSESLVQSKNAHLGLTFFFF